LFTQPCFTGANLQRAVDDGKALYACDKAQAAPLRSAA
jgi:hypothetical protein